MHLARNANVIISTWSALSREGHISCKRKKETMSWLRSSPLRTSFSKQRSRDSPPKDADPSACYDSFCKHSQQIYEIILHSLVRATIFRSLIVFTLLWNLHSSPGNVCMCLNNIFLTPVGKLRHDDISATNFVQISQETWYHLCLH